jgi:hypothetical protein
VGGYGQQSLCEKCPVRSQLKKSTRTFPIWRVFMLAEGDLNLLFRFENVGFSFFTQAQHAESRPAKANQGWTAEGFQISDLIFQNGGIWRGEGLTSPALGNGRALKGRKCRAPPASPELRSTADWTKRDEA